MFTDATSKERGVYNTADMQLDEGMKAAEVRDIFADLLVALDPNTREGFVEKVTYNVATVTGNAPKHFTSFLTESASVLTATQ